MLDEAAGLGAGLRETVILTQAAIEYHVNRIMLHRFGTAALESGRINSKIMSLNDIGIIDGTLRQDLIQIARIRHHFAHRRNADEAAFLQLLGGIRRRDDAGGTLRERFLAAVRPSYTMILQADTEPLA